MSVNTSAKVQAHSTAGVTKYDLQGLKACLCGSWGQAINQAGPVLCSCCHGSSQSAWQSQGEDSTRLIIGVIRQLTLVQLV